MKAPYTNEYGEGFVKTVKINQPVKHEDHGHGVIVTMEGGSVGQEEDTAEQVTIAFGNDARKEDDFNKFETLDEIGVET